MPRCGDVFENRATGEYAVILRGSEDRGDGPIVAHLLVRPGGAVTGEHVHPFLNERFTVLRGRLDARVDGHDMSLGPGQSVGSRPASPTTGGTPARQRTPTSSSRWLWRARQKQGPARATSAALN